MVMDLEKTEARNYCDGEGQEQSDCPTKHENLNFSPNPHTPVHAHTHTKYPLLQKILLNSLMLKMCLTITRPKSFYDDVFLKISMELVSFIELNKFFAKSFFTLLST